MRKITKKKYRKTKARTKINIQHNKGRGKESYQEVVDKFKIIFGEKVFSKILYYSNPNYIQKFIDLLNIERNKPKNSNLNNNEQITNILHPALEDFLNFIRTEYFVLRPIIPSIVNTDKVLKPSRIEKILRLAKKDRLIEEFIRDLEVLKLGPDSTINIPPISSPIRLQSPSRLPSSELAPSSELVPVPVPPPSQYKFKSPHRSKSPHKSESPYKFKSPHRSKSPVPIVAIRVRRVSQSNPSAIKVNKVLNLGQGRNYKKTRRHKKH
jgi:hypothetical protein